MIEDTLIAFSSLFSFVEGHSWSATANKKKNYFRQPHNSSFSDFRRSLWVEYRGLYAVFLLLFLFWWRDSCHSSSTMLLCPPSCPPCARWLVDLKNTHARYTTKSLLNLAHFCPATNQKPNPNTESICRLSYFLLSDTMQLTSEPNSKCWKSTAKKSISLIYILFHQLD